MYILFNIMLGLCLSLLVFMGYMLYRNNKVWDFRTRLIEENHLIYEQLPDYDTMYWKFWKPLKSFVPYKWQDEVDRIFPDKRRSRRAWKETHKFIKSIKTTKY